MAFLRVKLTMDGLNKIKEENEIMKNLSKNKKIIGAIAIILIAVILAIIIWIVVIRQE